VATVDLRLAAVIALAVTRHAAIDRIGADLVHAAVTITRCLASVCRLPAVAQRLVELDDTRQRCVGDACHGGPTLEPETLGRATFEGNCVGILAARAKLEPRAVPFLVFARTGDDNFRHLAHCLFSRKVLNKGIASAWH